MEWILAHGGLKKDAIYGYAWSGDFDSINNFITKEESFIPVAVAGYARGSFFAQVLDLPARHPNYDKECRKEAIYGFAQNQLHDQILSALRVSEDYAPAAIRGYAATNQKGQLTLLLKGTIYYPLAIQEAAKNGHNTLVEYLFNELGVNYTEKITPTQVAELNLLNHALVGFLEGSHFAEANHTLMMGALPMFCLPTLCKYNNRLEKEDLIAFLSHINDQDLRKLIAQDSLLDTINLALNDSDFALCESNLEMARGKNYLAARNNTLQTGKITLKSLNAIFLSEVISAQTAVTSDLDSLSILNT